MRSIKYFRRQSFRQASVLKMKKQIISIAVLCGFSIAAGAAPEQQYVALNIGSAKYANATLAGKDYPNPYSLDIVYGYKFAPDWFAEIGCTQFGNSILNENVQGVPTRGNIMANSTHAAVVGFLPVIPSFFVFAKAGYTFNISQLNLTQSNATSTSGANRGDLYYGAGGSYHINDTLSIRLQYENFGSFGPFAATEKDLTIEVISLGFVHSWK